MLLKPNWLIMDDREKSLLKLHQGEIYFIHSVFWNQLSTTNSVISPALAKLLSNVYSYQTFPFISSTSYLSFLSLEFYVYSYLEFIICRVITSTLIIV